MTDSPLKCTRPAASLGTLWPDPYLRHTVSEEAVPVDSD